MKTSKINFTVIKALVKRDLRLYFSNPTGYVFITLFIFLSAAAAFWRERFFLNNLANLDQLNLMFPFLVMFFIPAITMGVWAEERKQGTDELLLTLPATDLEVILGKYLSTLGIYTAALLLSISHLVVLFWLGSPDIGLMVANYAGYWFIGAAFVALGMLASLLSPSATIAFILGALFCALFVFLEPIFGVLGRAAGERAEPLAAWKAFDDFAGGVVSFSSMLYFVSVAAAALYLSVILLSRRHWPRQVDRFKMGFHQTVRMVAAVIAVVGFNALVGRIGIRGDFTAENLQSLSKETRRLLAQIPADRPVYIQAYLSREVPRSYVQTRSNLYRFLKAIDASAGRRVEVYIHDTEPFSDNARDAREKFGITPVELSDVEGRIQATQVYLGVAFTCGAEEHVIPFFDRGLPTEYELARSIRVVAGAERKKIGILNTAANLFGGFDFNTFESEPAWPVVDELKKQYEVVQVSATGKIAEGLDGLVVALPSSLPQTEMDNLTAYIEAGNPTLLVDDPLPVVDPSLSPNEPAGAGTNPFMRGRGPEPQPKGNIDALMARLGIRWQTMQVIWDSYNPHPELANLPPEVVFVGRGNENPEAFNPRYAATAGLQEVVFMFPGAIDPARKTEYSFDPLVRTGNVAGGIGYDDLVQKTFFGIQIVNPKVNRMRTTRDFSLAARIHGSSAGIDSLTGQPKLVNVIMVADLDFISNQFFEIRKQGIEGFNFDNVPFFLNCIDMLVGDDSFIALRNRRVRHRTLETLESRTRAFVERRTEEEHRAELDAQQALGDAQWRLNQSVRELRARQDLDEQTKEIMARNLQEVESRRFEAVKANIEAEKAAKLQRSKENIETQIRSIQGGIKLLAGLAPPVPVFALGIFVFLRRRRREKEGAAAARRLRG
jgi:ABC-2 type transport system permease protein